LKSNNVLYLIGIDDTDNLESRGTGFRARGLGEFLAANELATVTGITRHQLLVDPRIPYTSHNSSACLTALADPSQVDDLIAACRMYLERESAPGADAGLCVAPAGAPSNAVCEFGARAKREVLTRAEALALAAAAGVWLEGVTGTHDGLIGACAAVGLRNAGNDGRFLWLPGLRELNGVYAAGDLRAAAHIDAVHTVAGTAVAPAERVDVGEWLRPVLHEGQAVLLVEPVTEPEPSAEWRVAAKELIKARSDQ
jgi:hypothetical protein